MIIIIIRRKKRHTEILLVNNFRVRLSRELFRWKYALLSKEFASATFYTHRANSRNEEILIRNQ